MAKLFDLYCLKSYPSLDAMDELAKQRGDVSLSAEGLPRPGKVWAVQTKLGRTVVSGMAGDLPGCSVRRMTPAGLLDTRPFVRALKAWAKAHHYTLQSTKPWDMPGMRMAGEVARDEAGKVAEGFVLSLIDFKHHRPEGLADAGEDGPGVEIILGRGSSTLPYPKP